ncbi:MAG: tRNA (adenosine(37)-N6)-dimethylallyltransferase MiaA [Elusimicrobiota bacterium]|jgi:tRNA dimethylallyltransferase|nr:tRNA (adenosine(37)-N6)-dimethylallyltransferase MiaA [Elusimicrobiota bacterium]
MKHKLPIILAGPTASGKTEVALRLARLLGGEIISCDSRQIYKYLNAGTAAPEGAWEGGFYKVDGAIYHLVDFLDPAQSYDVSQFTEAAKEITAAKPDAPFIFAGGTGMYIQSYFTGMDKLPRGDAGLRAELSFLVNQHGKEALHARLAAVDAQSAREIPAGNVQRVMRAMEIYLLTGRPASVLRTGKFSTDISPAKACFVYLNWEKEALNKRIEERSAQILEPMIEETAALLARGYKEDAPGLKSLGYRQAVAVIKGQSGKKEALDSLITLTRRYAKRQRTWFARYRDIYKIDLNSRQDFDPQETARRILRLRGV